MSISAAGIFFVCGLIAGSFLNAAIYRLPRGISLARPGSHCPGCGHALRFWENLPVISYVIQRGRCRHCRLGFGLRYLAVELLCGAGFAEAIRRSGPGPAAIKFSLFAALLIGLVATDWDCQQLPDEFTLGGLVLALAFSYWQGPAGLTGWAGVMTALEGAAAGAMPLWLLGYAYQRLRGRAGMGLGDVKMMAMVGAFLGAGLALFTLALGALLGGVASIALMLWVGAGRWRRTRGRKGSRAQAWMRAQRAMQALSSRFALPFGVCLGLMGWVSWAWGGWIWDWYWMRLR